MFGGGMFGGGMFGGGMFGGGMFGGSMFGGGMFGGGMFGGGMFGGGMTPDAKPRGGPGEGRPSAMSMEWMAAATGGGDLASRAAHSLFIVGA